MLSLSPFPAIGTTSTFTSVVARTLRQWTIYACDVRGVFIHNNYDSPYSKVDVRVNMTRLTEYPSASQSLVENFRQTLDLGTSGLGGLDTGTKAINTFYKIFIIGKDSDDDGVCEAAGVIATSSTTTPLMPSGWTLLRPVGWCKTDGSGNLYKTHQIDDQVYYDERAFIIQGSVANVPAPTTLSVASLIPPGAVRAYFKVRSDNECPVYLYQSTSIGGAIVDTSGAINPGRSVDSGWITVISQQIKYRAPYVSGNYYVTVVGYVFPLWNQP